MTLAGIGRLYCIATPIGNLQDITLRAVELLGRVSAIACEDTRSAGILLSRLGIRAPRLVSLYEHNEERRVGQLVRQLSDGDEIALISEAGTPTVSDPGYRLVTACVSAGITVVPVPGPCAAIAALCASGLPTDRFLFLGFPPRKGAKLGRFVDRAVQEGVTAIVYLPARRLEQFLELVGERTAEARVVIARELTKQHEEFLRGRPPELRALLAERSLKGECTVLIHVAGRPGALEAEESGV